ncbi:hypothetical protein CDAR_47781 [Caerostris darwini]|uniref:Uncharacterized protein n=1 Tax=Caerostris darwini TaxID=1538125 RepID=A0AAV4M9F1_9ARAC|nr:hypothetical protein CDAR_47781 [Caerostris darwini]
MQAVDGRPAREQLAALKEECDLAQARRTEQCHRNMLPLHFLNSLPIHYLENDIGFCSDAVNCPLRPKSYILRSYGLNILRSYDLNILRSYGQVARALALCATCFGFE